MEITVNEAMKLKNEMSVGVNRLQHSARYGVSFGMTLEDGQEQRESANRFEDVFANLKQLLTYSNEINTTLAVYNAENGVSKLVRERQNIQMQIEILENAMAHSTPTSVTNTEYVSGVGKVQRTITFQPHVSREHLSKRISDLRRTLRAIDSDIFSLNAQTIELSFSYDDIDALIEVASY